MKRHMSWALLAAGTALAAATATAVPASAATSGRETFKGAIVTSGVSGTRTVVTTVVIAKGAFSGVGRIVEVENQPGDPDRVTRDNLVFARGSMHLKSTTLGDPQPSVNPRSCVATITIHQTGEIVGGTRQFSHRGRQLHRHRHRTGGPGPQPRRQLLLRARAAPRGGPDHSGRHAVVLTMRTGSASSGQQHHPDSGTMRTPHDQAVETDGFGQQGGGQAAAGVLSPESMLDGREKNDS